MQDYEVTLIIKSGKLTFRVQADDELQAVDYAWNSISETPNLVSWNVATDEGLHLVEEVK